MIDRPNAVTMRGNPLTLVGDEIKVGDKAPDFKVLGNDLSEKTLADLKGKVNIILAVPSLDTDVCDIEAKRFNQEAGSLGEGAQVSVFSMDLPFAQKRWAGDRGITHLKTFSDHKTASFGLAYGVLIRELRLLGRCVFVVDKGGVVRYIDLVKEISQEPDYDAALKAARILL